MRETAAVIGGPLHDGLVGTLVECYGGCIVGGRPTLKTAYVRVLDKVGGSPSACTVSLRR